MRIRQIVFAANDLSKGRDSVARLFQLDTPFRDPGVAEFGIDNAVFTFGDQFIEVISPLRSGTACGRHLERRGDSGYMLILQTDDLSREQARCDALGVRSVWSVTFDNISAMHLHPKDVGGAIVSIDQPQPPASWRWGGPRWQGEPLIPSDPASRQRVHGLALRAQDPRALAERWAQVLGCPPPTVEGHVWRVALKDGFIDFQATSASTQGDGIVGFTLGVASMPAVLAQARLLGLPVHGDSLTLMGTHITLKPLVLT